MQPEPQAVVITPTLNERENIALHVRDVFQAVPQVSMLIVDDGSRDGTVDEIEALRSTRYPRLHLLERTGPPSFAASYRDGFHWALHNDFRSPAPQQLTAHGNSRLCEDHWQ